MMVAPPPAELEAFWKTMQEAEKVGDAYLKRRADALAKIKIKSETLVKRGDPVNMIVDTARDKRVDLIAMTSHGRSGLERVFYGSVASGVLHKVDRPLLLIRAHK
jgi:nucleotide-binding universal stress UspA family protein